jgi:hypothetical protein
VAAVAVAVAAAVVVAVGFAWEWTLEAAVADVAAAEVPAALEWVLGIVAVVATSIVAAVAVVEDVVVAAAATLVAVVAADFGKLVAEVGVGPVDRTAASEVESGFADEAAVAASVAVHTDVSEVAPATVADVNFDT